MMTLGLGAAIRRPDAFTLVSLRGDGTGAAIKEDTGRAVTVAGNATQAAGRFIGGAISAPAAGDYLSLPDSADFALGTGNLTLETWVSITTMPNASEWGYICSQYASTTSLWYWRFRRNASTDPIQGYLDMVIAPDGAAVFVSSTIYTVTTNSWYHFAVTRSGNSWRFFVNGTQIGNAATQAAGIPNVAAAFLFPRYAALVARQLKGVYDEFKFSTRAKWTSNFTPPTRRT